MVVLGVFMAVASAKAQTVCEDADGDGYSGTTGCGPVDCNDADMHVYPGATEACNGWDDNCDGALDEGCGGICTTPEKRYGEREIEYGGGAFQRNPSMVRIRNGYALTWNQQVDDEGVECDGEIRVARVDEDGRLRYGSVRVGAPGSPGRAARSSRLGWSGREFIVGFSDQPVSDCTTPGLHRAYFQRLSPALTPLGEPTDVSCHQFAVSTPAGAVWTGTGWVVVWSQAEFAPGTGGFFAARLDAAGVMLDPCGVQLHHDSTPTGEGNVVSNGDHFLIAWRDSAPEGPQFNSEIYVQRFSFDLVPIDPTPQRITYNDGLSDDVSVVWADGEWALAWRQDFVLGYHEIAFARLDANVEVITPPGIVQITTGADQPGGFNKGLPQVRWTGAEYGIPYHLQNNPTNAAGDLFFARLTADGTHLPPDVPLTAGGHRGALFHDAVWNGEDFGIAAQDRTNEDIIVMKFSRVGCRCADLDGDGFTSCAGGDCDDTRSDIHLLRPELCGDGVDNDCDGLADCNDKEACPVQGAEPGPVTGLTADADKASWNWAPTPDADRYDVVRGWLTSLPYEGDARDAECVGSEIAVSTLFDPDLPVTADGFFYLIRARSGPSASCLNGPWGSADDDAILDCP